MSVALHQAMAERNGAFLRTVWPQHTAKLAAREFGIAEATVKGWLAGKFPASNHFADLLQRFGARYAACVLAPAGHWADVLQLEAEAEALRERVDGLNAAWAEYRHRKGSTPS